MPLKPELVPSSPLVPDEVIEGRTDQEWADYVLEPVLGAAVEMGQRLIEMKAHPEVPHGRFERIVKNQMNRTRQWAGQLMRIARHPALSNGKHVFHLPDDRVALYHLSGLPPEVIDEWFDKRLIHPMLKRGDAFKMVRDWRESQAESDETSEPVTVLGLYHGDFRKALDDVPDGTVDLIFTDPPYPKEDLPLYGDLAVLAARLLKPRGLLFTYAGNLFFTDVIDRLRYEGLTWGWQFALRMEEGSQSRVRARNLIQTWKPILVFSKGAWPSSEWQKDEVINPVREKGLYEWQQGLAPAVELIERFTKPDDLVLDPMMGVGTTGVAAAQLDRRFIGVEIDEQRFAQASQRIAKAQI